MVERVIVTPQAAAVVERLKAVHGPLMFHQSGGCCDGSSPMCYPRGEFKIGGNDIRLGEIVGCPVYIDGDQFALWAHTQLIIDLVKGRGAGFSLESPYGVRFLTRGHVFTEAEAAQLRPIEASPA